MSNAYEAAYGYEKDNFEEKCPVCGEEHRIRASNSPTVILISGRTDGKQSDSEK